MKKKSMKDLMLTSEDWDEISEDYAKAQEQPAWDGEGLPPVGTVCEVMFKKDTNPTWDECEVLKTAPFIVLYFADEGKAHNYSPESDFKFRPIKTDRDRQIEAMTDLFKKTACKQTYNIVAGIEALYEAGARIEGV